MALAPEVRVLLDYGLRLVPQWPGSKRPIAMPGTSSMWPVETTEEAAQVFDVCQRPNWAWHLDTSPVVVVEVDGDGGLGWLREQGVTSTARTWIQWRRGGWPHVFYRRPAGISGRFVKLGPGGDVDFLGAGCITVPPSVHSSGRPYEWVRGKGPRDIALSDLDALPEPLAKVWRDEQAKRHRPPVRHAAVLPVDGTLIEAVIAQLGGRESARGHGSELSFHCPWPEQHRHGDRKASFGLNVETGAWLCWSGCGAGRGIWSLARKLGVEAPRDRLVTFNVSVS